MDNHHELVIGRSGFGKSNYSISNFFDLIRDGDRALCYIDPHGADAMRLLDVMPRQDIKRTVVIDPLAPSAVGFNPIPTPEAAIAGLKSIWIDTFLQSVSGWGPNMEYLLLMGLHALQATKGTTFRDLPKLYYNKPHRAKLLGKVTNPDTLRFWLDEYPSVFEKAKDNPARPIINKVGQINHSAIARILCQTNPKLDLVEAIKARKIIIVNLNCAIIGDEAAGILGSLVTTCLRHALKSANYRSSKLHRLDLFVDEFRKVGSAQFDPMLSEDRKAGLTLHLAIQYLFQLPHSLQKSILGNVRHKTIFNVEPEDADILVRQYRRPVPGSEDYAVENLTSLDPFEAIMDGRREKIAYFDPPGGKLDDVLKHSHLHYGRPL